MKGVLSIWSVVLGSVALAGVAIYPNWIIEKPHAKGAFQVSIGRSFILEEPQLKNGDGHPATGTYKVNLNRLFAEMISVVVTTGACLGAARLLERGKLPQPPRWYNPKGAHQK